MRSHTLTSAILMLGCTALGGCTSRTLPLPPPTVEELGAPDADGLVLVRGLALEGASVGVLNAASNPLVAEPEVRGIEALRFESPAEASLRSRFHQAETLDCFERADDLASARRNSS